MLSLNIVNIDVRWRQYCRTLAVGNKIISSEKNAQPHLKNGFRNTRGLWSDGLQKVLDTASTIDNNIDVCILAAESQVIIFLDSTNSSRINQGKYSFHIPKLIKY